MDATQACLLRETALARFQVYRGFMSKVIVSRLMEARS